MKKYQVAFSDQHMAELSLVADVLGASTLADTIRRCLGLGAFVAREIRAGRRVAILHEDGSVETVKFL